jgi:hypothetical protein
MTVVVGPARLGKAACAVALLAACLPLPARAENQWVEARLGSFETVSDNGRRSAIQALSQFEQFRFALGAVMGQPDLRLEPALRILVFRTPTEMSLQGFTGLREGRDHLMACATAEGQLPAELIRELTRRLLEENFANMAPAMEKALETFFGTVQSNAVHVTWGAPPPPADRTREWALLHRLITQPDYSGRAHIYLHNLAQGMDSNGAVRSLSEDPAKFNAEVDRYYSAGVFTAVAAPNRPLNPERDFTTTVLTSDEGQLMRADLLTPASAGTYESLLKSGKHVTEAHEGLGIIAMRDGDSGAARTHMEAARRGGTRNFVALTDYSKFEKDPERAIAILKEALTLDAKYAPAHWALGERIADIPRRLAEWKQAVALAPRNYEWLATYAQLNQDQKQYAEAGRAWMAAAQAAPDEQRRQQYLSARTQIEQLRLDDEDVARRRAALMQAAETARLKEDAKRQLSDLEDKYNTKPLSKEEAAKVVDWDEVHGSASVTGVLLRVDCTGRQVHLQVKDAAGKVQMLVGSDPSQIEMVGSDPLLTCGPQKTPRPVKIDYQTDKDTKKVTPGEITRIEFR